ncbi:MAG: discoidin domain-containing protein [Magnetococcales bacterium]|nr:discoidin domain-containing protein [Magnetococcales bacterium]
MALHRYWRVYMTQSTSGSDMLLSFYEIEFRGSVGGADQSTGGTAAASHNNETVYKLFNENFSDYWSNGGPAADSWVSYDFGVAVAVAELSLTPRSSFQAPTAFSLEYSDTGTAWTELARWSGVTGWISGVGKLFVPPAVRMGSQSRQPFAVALASGGLRAYDLGGWCQAHCRFPAPLLLEAARLQGWGEWAVGALSQRFDCWLERALQHPFSPTLSAAQGQPWRQFISCACGQPLFERLQRAGGHFWSMRQGVWADHGQPIVATWERGGCSSQPFVLQLRNTLAVALRSYWQLASHHCVVRTPVPALHWAGPGSASTVGWEEGVRPLSLHSGRLQHGENACCWSAELQLAQEADFAAMQLDDAFVVRLDGLSFRLLVTGKRRYRTGDGRVKWLLYGSSPAVRHLPPRGAVISRQWLESQRARAVVEQLLGEEVVWLLPDWRLPAGRLLVQDRTAMEIVRQIAGAVGGVVQSRPDGRLVVQPRFSCGVAEWSVATPHHLLTDAQDILAMAELQQARVRLDQVMVSNGPLSGSAAGGVGRVVLEPDRRPAGPNQGRKRFVAGESAQLVVMPGQGADDLQLASSAGSLRHAGPLRWQQTEDLVFVVSDRARLAVPAQQLLSVLWLGNGLGDPVLQADGLTVQTPVAGTAVARVTYEVVAAAYSVQIPAQVAGVEQFPLLVTATGWSGEADFLEVAMQRGGACHPVRRLVEPLLADPYLLSLRARAELDQGEALQRVELTIVYRSGLEPGQLVEVQDGGYGCHFRGVVVEVSHELEPQGWVSRLVLLRGVTAVNLF